MTLQANGMLPKLGTDPVCAPSPVQVVSFPLGGMPTGVHWAMDGPGHPLPVEHPDLLWKRTEDSGCWLWWQKDLLLLFQTDTISVPPRGLKPPLSHLMSASGEQICTQIQSSRDMSSSDRQKAYVAPLQEGV
ncbi:hypothetical protein AMECASPLE_039401 [Ameca splendens]|uniref:Uncharacterized protein n=1 Tax=Ameca splendens TaxID=208324 RepID=A0ABV0XLI9_9TELE